MALICDGIVCTGTCAYSYATQSALWERNEPGCDHLSYLVPREGGFAASRLGARSFGIPGHPIFGDHKQSGAGPFFLSDGPDNDRQRSVRKLRSGPIFEIPVN